MFKVLEATLSYFKQWLKVLKMGISSSDTSLFDTSASTLTGNDLPSPGMIGFPGRLTPGHG